MCFSAGASFIVGGALGATGVYTLSKAKKKTELPFASIPLLFGIQQAIEGVIWISFGSPLINTVMIYAYSIFSHVLWPIYVPLSVVLLETVPWRKKVLLVFLLMGIVVSTYLLYFLLTLPLSAQVVNRSIVYISPHFYVIPMLILYFSSTCISSLFSSHKIINMFGIAALLSAAIAYKFYATSFISVWCFFAAILSSLIFLYFKLKKNSSI